MAPGDLSPGRMTAQKRKKRLWFGYLPLWSEFVPLDPKTGRLDGADLAANIGAGFIIGLREVLGGIVSASLIFSSSDVDSLSAMYPFGICMMWYSSAFGAIWYAIFGRLQYCYSCVQDVIGILQAGMAVKAAHALRDEPHRIAPTVLGIISLTAVLTGIASLILSKLGLAKYMLLFPTPVTAGFLGAIGFVILRSSLQTSSGVQWHYVYPVDTDAFCDPNSLAQVGMQLATVCFIRTGPHLLARCFPGSSTVMKLGGLLCQLVPFGAFYLWVAYAGISMETLEDWGWLYPNRPSGGAAGFWTTYDMRDADVRLLLSLLPEMAPAVMMSVLCTMTGVLAITDRFPRGPTGDPDPMETIDFDKELTTVGVSSFLLGLTGGTLTFHTFTVIQLRMDGGTHRISVLAFAILVICAFVSNAPLGHIVPKWYLAALFMNTAIHFLKGAIMSYQQLPTVRWRGWRLPSPQYAISLSGILAAVFLSPAMAISLGLLLSVVLFLVHSSQASPVSNVVLGDGVVSRTMRPFWEMKTLRAEGDRILLLYLQGQLFFGSVRKLVATLDAAAASDRVEYVILSFSRVPRVDPSAVRHLKTTTDRMREQGCVIICCRMNHEVFSALSAAGVVSNPDPDLVMHLQGLRWRSSPAGGAPGGASKVYGKEFARVPSEIHRYASPKTKTQPLLPKSPLDPLEDPFNDKRGVDMDDEPDAFSHETDALDYCDERLVAQSCYGRSCLPAEPLRPYMLKYRQAATDPGARLDEWAFEQMNGLPPGFMNQLRPYCEVRIDVPQWTKLLDCVGSLVFIMQGAISLVQSMPQAEEVVQLSPEVRGFSFRQGKRLHKRFCPGYVVGKHSFFLNKEDQILDQDLFPKLIVSSKLGNAELWILGAEAWQKLPLELKGPVTEMLCVQLSDISRHSALQER
eukprot:TRINITY_DN29027_c0_g2_i1.p1 TRINITY_DN29027_c0_g2~~TRINITY_DN29027_c0_g2_i1.p1  ORF type:complete len:912 (+),score=170.47 TRINITY_DN29027_c0_g2_i1:133-2868(+)